MKKKILIGSAIAVVVLIVAACIIFKAPPIFTQPIENVKAVSATSMPYYTPADEFEDDPRMTIEFKQKADMYTIYQTAELGTRVRKIGAKNKLVTAEPAYEVVFTYTDGATDTLFASTDPEYLLRCINPEAPEAKRKYVRIYCPSMSKYLSSWIPTGLPEAEE